MGQRVAVIGSGSYGCVLANLLKQNGHDVKIWSFDESECKDINERHYCKYIDGTIDSSITCTTSIEEAIVDTNYIIIVTPSFAVRNVCRQISNFIKNQDIIIASKGLEGNKVLSEVANEEINKTGVKKEISVISGPSHAEQIYRGVPTFFDYNGYEDIRLLLSNDNIIMKFSSDPIGMQLGAALKNIIAIKVGELLGMSNKDVKDFKDISFENYSNTISAYIVQGLSEIKTIGDAMGAKERTFDGYSGLGDLLTTTLSVDSRNLKCGIRLGQGKKLDEIKSEIGMTIEGLNALDSAMGIVNEKGLNCPLIKTLYEKVHKDDIIKGTKTLNKSMQEK